MTTYRRSQYLLMLVLHAMAGCHISETGPFISGERVALDTYTEGVSAEFIRVRTAVATAEYERAIVIHDSGGKTTRFELPPDAGPSGDLSVYDVQCANGKRFIKLVDNYGEYWICPRPAAGFTITRQAHATVARRYRTEFESVPIVFEEGGDPEAWQSFLESIQASPLDRLTGGSYKEQLLGRLGGVTGRLQFAREKAQ